MFSSGHDSKSSKYQVFVVVVVAAVVVVAVDQLHTLGTDRNSNLIIGDLHPDTRHNSHHP